MKRERRRPVVRVLPFFCARRAFLFMFLFLFSLVGVGCVWKEGVSLLSSVYRNTPQKSISMLLGCLCGYMRGDMPERCSTAV